MNVVKGVVKGFFKFIMVVKWVRMFFFVVFSMLMNEIEFEVEVKDLIVVIELKEFFLSI